ncbi:glycoside hydrolase family 3 C-terminal domain-containing protein [Lentzea sp. NPDC051208]|uniref:glycoside hydrolase family 3 C-terminal domain-containing protein n=1 Tax=Lentzea sp. NPDC051208 TaxID=3154642 RepID=UPI00343ADAD7
MNGEHNRTEVLASLTLREKASLLSGGSAWATTSVDRVGIPSTILTDGPHGVRLHDPEAPHFDFSRNLPATCFPTAAALGSSWDVDLLTEIGEALGTESRAAGVGVLLGPGVNIKRSPLCGRNFEYLSEDPLLAGHLGAALVRGIQHRGVGASVKHFAANNQETDRMRVDSVVDERTLREIYLAAFEHIITTAAPWTVMAAYNKVNGTHAAEHPWLLTSVLREEWGFDGVVVSDWGAVADPVAAVAAGLDLEMPSTGGLSARRIVEAVESGQLDEAVVDRAVTRLLGLLDRVAEGAREPAPNVDVEQHHALARRAAAESAVLLKNDDAILPLDPDAHLDIAVVGEFARTLRFQGGGSSHVNPTRTENALDALRSVAGEHVTLSFAPGFPSSGEQDRSLLAEAVAAAASADIVLMFLGLPEEAESEGWDRADLDLPAVQLQALRAVAQVNDNIVVVLANGGVVRVSPWAEHAKAVLETWLGGQAGGAAVADLLFGRTSPSGRLAETIPLRLEDTPSYLDFPGTAGTAHYGERQFVGYRYYDRRDMAVDFGFGHGLSYTTFGYSDLHTEVMNDSPAWLRLTAAVTNTGARPGKEVVQVYIGAIDSPVERAVRELKAFAKVDLRPGESTTVEFALTIRDFSYYSTAHGDWVCEGGEFEIAVGASSRDLRLTTAVTAPDTRPVAALRSDSTVGEWMAHPIGGPLLKQVLSAGSGSGVASDPDIARMVGSLPLNRLLAMSGGRLVIDVDQLVARANGHSA